MKMLQKIIDCKSSEIYQENIYDGNFLVKLDAYSAHDSTLF